MQWLDKDGCVPGQYPSSGRRLSHPIVRTWTLSTNHRYISTVVPFLPVPSSRPDISSFLSQYVPSSSVPPLPSSLVLPSSSSAPPSSSLPSLSSNVPAPPALLPFVPVPVCVLVQPLPFPSVRFPAAACNLPSRKKDPCRSPSHRFHLRSLACHHIWKIKV